MKALRPDTLKGKTVLVLAVCLTFSHIVGLALYVIFSASTVTLEREEQIADRIMTVTRLIEHAPPPDRPYLADELTGPRFRVAVEEGRLVDPAPVAEGGSTITQLLNRTVGAKTHRIAAQYRDFPAFGGDAATDTAPEREVSTQRFSSLFRIHEELLVSIDLPDGTWLNFTVSGSAWDHIWSPNIIPSVLLITVVTLLVAWWAVGRALTPLSRFARASEDLGVNVYDAPPVAEEGPREVREAAKAFNEMQRRIRSLLEARNQMLGAVSHDFRTPLTRLRLRAEAINDPDQYQKAVQDLNDMETMIAATLAFARDEAEGEGRETVDIAALIREVCADLSENPDDISLELEEGLLVECQPVSIRRVLTNVIDNAVLYGARVRVSAFANDGNVVIDADDDGPGIPPADRDKVFTPFRRLEQSRNRETGGAGLGLSIAQTIVRGHGGSIELTDSPLGGLRVRMVLPRQRRDPPIGKSS